MKTLKYVALIMITLLGSCINNEPIKQTTELNFQELFKQSIISDPAKYNHINIAATNIYGTINRVSVTNDVLSGTRPKLWVNSISISPEYMVTDFIDGDRDYLTKNERPNMFPLSLILSEFGKNINIKTEKVNPTARGEASIETIEVYNPQIINVYKKEDLSVISKEKDLFIKWNEDIINNKPIVITLIARSYISSGEPIYKKISLTKVVKDVGYYVLSQNELQIFPNGIRLDIMIGRGNQQILGSNTAITLYSYELIPSKII